MIAAKRIHLLWLPAAILGNMALTSFATDVVLGPPNPGAEQGFDSWYHGTRGAGYLRVDDTDPHSGSRDFVLGNTTAGPENRSDWRSLVFPLGTNANGTESINFSLAYKFPGKVGQRDNIAVYLRFFDAGTNFLGQQAVMLGASSGDSEMANYKPLTLTGIRALKKAPGTHLPENEQIVLADIWVTCGVFQPWTSGDAHFDDFMVTMIPPSPWLARHWLISLAAMVILPALIFTVAIARRQGKAGG